MMKSVESSINSYPVSFPAEITINVSQGVDIFEKDSMYDWNCDNYINDMDNFEDKTGGLWDQDGILEDEDAELVDTTTILEDAWDIFLNELDDLFDDEYMKELGVGYHSVNCDITLTYWFDDVYRVEDTYAGDVYYEFDDCEIKLNTASCSVDNITVD